MLAYTYPLADLFGTMLGIFVFLIGISGHFRFFRIRLGLVLLGGLMLIVAVVQIVTSPPIP